MQPSSPGSPKLGLRTGLRLLKGIITYSDAADSDRNILHTLTYFYKRERLVEYLLEHAKEIEDIVSYYLRLQGAESCRLAPREDWINGSFNICLPVNIDNWTARPGGRVMVRFPLPFKVGDLYRPGNGDEKLRSETATYDWISENCPDVPIPYLWGFAFAPVEEGAEGFSVSDLLTDGEESCYQSC